MQILLGFAVGLLLTFFLTRVTNWLFGRGLSERGAAIGSFVLFGGIALFAMAARMVPVRPTLFFGLVPLIVWLLIDVARARKRDCPNCGRRIPKTAMSCPKCGRDLDTMATVEEDSGRR